jgi:organic radical activating enzyme
MNIEFDVTLGCNFSCVNCNRHSNFNNLKDPTNPEKEVGLNLYENTNIEMAKVKKFAREVRENGNIERIHLIGGEPLAHPFMDKICEYLRDEIYGSSVPEILIISNIHPKMLKKGTLDTPEEIIKYFPWKHFDKINLDHITGISRYILQVVNQHMKENNLTPNDIIKDLDNLAIPIQGKTVKLRSVLEEEYTLNKNDKRQLCSFFFGIPVINYKPLSAKAEDHRCTLVAPYDSGQEMIESCNVPRHCGINFSFDGYWPCSQGSAIARLFKMYEYRKTTLPKNEADWDGVDEDGNAKVFNSGMWDICKLCQLAAKNPMEEKKHGRPISISYRKALGMEEGMENLSEYVVEGHKKKLTKVPVFRKRNK